MTTDFRYPGITIIGIAGQEGYRVIRRLLSGAWPLEAASSSKTWPKRGGPSERVYQLLKNSPPVGLGVRTVIVEESHNDADWLEAVQNFHMRAFYDVPRTTRRLHFFSAPVAFDDFLHPETLVPTYLGYCTVIPSQPPTIGRSILALPSSLDTAYAVVSTRSTVNLAGMVLTISGSLFMQQDSVTSSSATVALWLSTVLAQEHLQLDLQAWSPTKITRFAFSVSDHGLPGPSMTVSQMIKVLDQIGFGAFVHSVYDVNEAKRLMVTYLDSGIAPIMIVNAPEGPGLVALPVVGYKQPSLSPVLLASSNEAFGSLAEGFLVTDESFGPYLEVRVQGPNPATEPRPTFTLMTPETPSDEPGLTFKEFYEEPSIHYILGPMPTQVRRDPVMVSAAAEALMRELYMMYQSLAPGGRTPGLQRTYLTNSNRFKQRQSEKIRRTPIEMADDEALLHFYRGALYPPHIWVSEFLEFQSDSASVDSLRIVGDVVLDPYSAPNSLEFVTARFRNILFRNDPSHSSTAESLANPVMLVMDANAGLTFE